MEHLILPKDYKSELNLHDTQLAIKTVKDFFQALLAQRLHLTRVSAPLFVDPETGLNDNLNGYERPVTFGIKEQNDKNAEVHGGDFPTGNRGQVAHDAGVRDECQHKPDKVSLIKTLRACSCGR